ncbi:hypothetical protein [Bacillus toyonensis]
MKKIENLYYPPSVSKDNKILVKLSAVGAREYGLLEYRRLCGCSLTGECHSSNHGKSNVDVAYSSMPVKDGNYFIQVVFKRFGLGVYGDGQDAWDKFENASSANSAAGGRTSFLGGPYDPGRSFQFPNGNNQTNGLRTGALGLGIYSKRNMELVSWALWYFDGGWGNWGNEWYRCGHKYDFWFDDNE